MSAPLDDLHTVDLDLRPNEASGLLEVDEPAVLEALGWETGFWTVLDEALVERSIALIGRRAGAPSPTAGWEPQKLVARRTGHDGKCEDGEALARLGGHVYAFGSHFGKKAGPLQPKRSWVARFGEAAAGDGDVDLEVVRDPFRFHRVVNDALVDARLDLVPPHGDVHERFVEAARVKEGGEPWAGRLRTGDRPVNVEGAAFRRDGRLLLGLRFPVTADGHPLVVEVAGTVPWFESGGGEAPEVTGIWILDGVGAADRLTGVRELHLDRDLLHVVTGNLDATGTDALILAAYPDGLHADSAHWCVQLPPDGGGRLRPDLVRRFPGVERVEGLATDGAGHVFYVEDEDDRVLTRFAELSLP